MMDDHDDLDRALFALPLEPLPDGLRASILAAITVPARPLLTAWESLGIGIILALATWLVVLFTHGGASGGAWLSPAVVAFSRVLTSTATVAWIGVGVGLALSLSLFSVPRRMTAGR